MISPQNGGSVDAIDLVLWECRSKALFVGGGTSNGAVKSSANTRPTQSVRGVDSISSIAGRLFRRIEIASSMGVKFVITILKSPPHLFH